MSSPVSTLDWKILSEALLGGLPAADLERRRLAIERLSERLDAMEAAQDQTETDLGGKVAVEPYPIERW